MMLSRCAPNDACISVVANLHLMDALPLSGASHPLRNVCMDVLGKAAASELDGADDKVRPWWIPEHLARRSANVRQICVCAAMQPRCLLRGCRSCWPDSTVPLPFSLETGGGALCLEFRVIVAKAPNGTPRVGFVDAGAPCLRQWLEGGAEQRWQGDFSRGCAGPGVFAVSICAACGLLAATGAAVPGPKTAWTARANECKQGYYAARLNWHDLGDCTRQWNEPYHLALVLERGTLTFYRHAGNGYWHTSGAVLSGLPREVLPCVFLSSFSGHAQVDFVRAWRTPPEVCQDCGCMWKGFMPQCMQ